MTIGLILTAAFVSSTIAAHPGPALETAYSVAAAVNAHSSAVRCVVRAEALTISCSADDSIGDSSAKSFANRLTAIMHENGVPDDWAVAVKREW